MELYNGHIDAFIADATQNRIAEMLSDAFFNYFGYKPSPGERDHGLTLCDV